MAIPMTEDTHMDEQELDVEEEKTEKTDLITQEQNKKPNPLAPYRKFLIGAAIGAVIACLIMLLGFWRVFFVCLMAGLGAFLLGAEDKKETIRKIVDRIIPNKK